MSSILYGVDSLHCAGRGRTIGISAGGLRGAVLKAGGGL